jgi:hypothetical protein
MASQGGKSKSKSKSRSRSSSGNGRGSSSKSSGSSSQRKPGDGQGPPSRRPDRKRSTPRSRPKYDDYAISDPRKIDDGPDVLIDVPVVKIDEIDFELDDLRARVAVLASVRKMVQISVGADVRLGKVELKIEGVEAQALLKARLNNVGAILDRVALTLDRNPELLSSIGRAVRDVGTGTGNTLEDAGDAVEDVGEGAEGAIQDIGQGAGQGVGQLGQGAGQGVGQVGQGAGQAVEGVGQGAGQAVGQVGQGAGQAVEGVGQGAQQLTGQLGQGGGQQGGVQ